jgi:hypothetical protein
MQIPVNYLAIVVAAVAGFVLSFAWYWLTSAIWMKARGKGKTKQEPALLPFLISGVAYLLMAWMLAGLMGSLGNLTVRGGLTSACYIWAGFVLTTTVVNHVFRNTRTAVILIDVGNWLAVLLLMGAIIGAFGM